MCKAGGSTWKIIICFAMNPMDYVGGLYTCYAYLMVNYMAINCYLDWLVLVTYGLTIF